MPAVMVPPTLTCPHCAGAIRLRPRQVRRAGPPTTLAPALAGPDGGRVAELLAPVVAEQSAVFAELARPAVYRFLRGDQSGPFLNDAEQRRLGDAIGSCLAAGELLGRAGVRDRWRQEKSGTVSFAESPAPFAAFAAPPPPHASAHALLTWLRDREPLAAVGDAAQWLAGIAKRAGALALHTAGVLAEKVRAAFAAKPDIAPDALLDAAGVGPVKRGYAQLVLNTAAHESFIKGTEAERVAPDVAPVLPAWQYWSARLPNSRPHHAARHGKIYPGHVAFADVRGTSPEDIFNCYCVPVVVGARELSAVRAKRPAAFAEFASYDPSKHPHVPAGSPEGGEFQPTGGGRKVGGGMLPPPPTPGSVSGPLTDAEKRAVRIFTSSSAILNEPLRTGGKFVGEQKKLISTLDTAIAKSPVLETPTTVYRGMRETASKPESLGMTAKLDGALASGEPIKFNNFISTSKDAETAFGQFGAGGLPGSKPIFLTIEARHGLDVGAATGHWQDQREMILPRQTAFRVVGTEQVPHAGGAVTGYRLEQVVHGGAAHAEFAAFDPSKHPHGQKGQWAPTGGAGQEPATGKAAVLKAKGRVPEEQPSAKAARAKAAHVLVGKDVQRYSEEVREPAFAKAMGGVSFPDSEPFDVAIAGKSGAAAHLVELKTVSVGKDEKLTMNSYAQVRKVEAERSQGATYHTVVSDDRAVKDANGPGQHDESKRVYFYRRGVAGSARLDSLHRVPGTDGAAEKNLKRLMAAPESELPPGAQRTDGHLRVGRWKFFQDAEGKGYTNSKTGQVFRAKK